MSFDDGDVDEQIESISIYNQSDEEENPFSCERQGRVRTELKSLSRVSGNLNKRGILGIKSDIITC